MARHIINVFTDFSRTFVDPDGSFYCGTTEEQRRNAAAIAAIGDLNLFCSDLHPLDSWEFAINGGLYPIHAVPRADELNMAEFNLEGKTASPQLTAVVHDAVDSSISGIYAPRQIYFQSPGGKLSYKPEDVEATFGLPIVAEKRILDEEFTYLVQPKYFFDATRISIRSDFADAGIPRIPKVNKTVFSMLRKKYPDDRDLVFIIPSVVENICTHHTAAGLKLDFPLARIIVPDDATTPLAGVGLGFDTAKDVKKACRGLARDIGIDYLSTEEILKEFSR